MTEQTLTQYAKEYREVVATLPHLPVITRLVVASDILSARRITEEYEQTKDPGLVWMVGSYARVDWAIDNLPKKDLLEIWPELWVSSDPDDTNPVYLEIWRECPHFDKPLTESTYKVYRGQRLGPDGFSWTLDRKVAEKFARTGGLREKIRDGVVLEKVVPREKILAYLVERGEDEVIIDDQNKYSSTERTDGPTLNG